MAYTPLPDSIKINVDKQEKTVKRLTGFALHPQYINREGRPKRKTLTEVLQDKLDAKIVDKYGKELDVTMRENLAALILNLVFEKHDRDIMKELWHYIDGMPKQKTEVSGPDGGPIPILAGATNKDVISKDNSDSEIT